MVQKPREIIYNLLKQKKRKIFEYEELETDNVWIFLHLQNDN